MIVKRIALVLVVAVAALIFLTRPGAQNPHVTVQNGLPGQPGQALPALLSRDQAKPQPPSEKAGAEGAPPLSEAADKALRGRIAAYWRARAKSDLLTAFTFYEPQFRRQYTPQEFLLKFQRLVRFKPEFLGVDRIRYEPGGSKAAASIRLRTRPDVVGGQEIVSVTEENWMLLSGTWCKKGEACCRRSDAAALSGRLRCRARAWWRRSREHVPWRAR